MGKADQRRSAQIHSGVLSSMPMLFKRTCLLIFLISLAACRPETPALTQPQNPVASLAAAITTVAPTPRPTVTLAPPAAPPPTPTAIATAPPVPTHAPTPTITPTPTLTPTPDPVDRTCRKPYEVNYRHSYLPAEVWPTPAPAPTTHFWLSKPLPPGSGRLLINDLFPYGSDYNGRLAMHTGVDISEQLGTPVLAAADGVVVVAGSDEDRLYGWSCNWYGHLVVIEHDFRWYGRPVYTLYGHVLNITVTPGQRVQRAEQIAEVGIGGAATVRHLHLEVRVGSNEYTATRNPMLWVAPGADRGVIAGRLIDPEGRPWQGAAIHALRQTEGGLEDRVVWSYLGDPSNIAQPDEDLAENFIFSDMATGSYQIYLELQGKIYSTDVVVTAGAIAQVEIVTAPYVAPVATPTPVDTPTTEAPTPAP